MEMDLDSRNAALVVGDELHDSVEIPGSEAHSTWGYDPNTRSYWASVWPTWATETPLPRSPLVGAAQLCRAPTVFSSNCAPSSDTIP